MQNLFVSPQGNDVADGSEHNPLATLAGARNAVRKSGLAGKKPVADFRVVSPVKLN